MKKKTMLIIAVLVILVVGWWLFIGRGDRDTRAFLELPERTVTIETGAEELVELKVRLAGSSDARSNAFKGVDPEVVEENILYMEYPFSASVSHRTEDIKTAIVIAFFDSEGELLAIFEAEPGEPEGYRPQDRYQYVVMAPAGLFEEKGIDEESRLRLAIE